MWLAMVGDWVVRLICFVLRARKSCGWSTAEYAHPKPFGCAFSLPEAQRVLHAQLTAVMAAQQHKPIRMGLPPVLTSLIRSVLSPMAAMAMMMKNLDSSLKGAKAAASTPARDAPVVIREASMKNSRKKGNTRRREKLPSPRRLPAWPGRCAGEPAPG